MTFPDFTAFPKMPRLNRDCIITEKLDGTNAQIYITENGDFFTGSRNRWITPADDNYGFSNWAHENKDELMKLGPGRHFGEWWGRGIQRNYGLNEKRFSLFNVSRWLLSPSPTTLPACVGLVPILDVGAFTSTRVAMLMRHLSDNGSIAAPGFMRPEGVVIYHTAANHCFKVTLENDEKTKSACQNPNPTSSNPTSHAPSAPQVTPDAPTPMDTSTASLAATIVTPWAK